jgi:hypothetical protein
MTEKGSEKSLTDIWALVCLLGVVACSSTPGAAAGPDSENVGPAVDTAVTAQDVGAPGTVHDAAASDKAGLTDAAEPADAPSPDAEPAKVCVQDAGPDLGSAPNCGATDDTDYDGVRDCLDRCPYDGLKITPGVCGCNQSDVDSDGDGIADCLDDCPHDPNNAGDGDCGCVGGQNLKPAGTPCVLTACPQSGATCDGAGVCGNRSACAPCPGGHYVFSEEAQTGYWFCGGSLPSAVTPSCVVQSKAGGPPATRMAAQSMCAARGLTLARIQSTGENVFVAQLITSPAWIGANALQTPGQWYWSSATSDSETLLWSGGPNGMRSDSLFVNWAAGAPASAACATISPTDGKWTDANCTRALAYVCEYLRHF